MHHTAQRPPQAPHSAAPGHSGSGPEFQSLPTQCTIYLIYYVRKYLCVGSHRVIASYLCARVPNFITIERFEFLSYQKLRNVSLIYHIDLMKRVTATSVHYCRAGGYVGSRQLPNVLYSYLYSIKCIAVRDFRPRRELKMQSLWPRRRAALPCEQSNICGPWYILGI